MRRELIVLLPLSLALVAEARLEEAPQAEKSRCITWERLQELDPGLLCLGELATRTSHEIKDSSWGVGCETMDRDYATFGNFKAFVAETGAKHARLQSGWDKTERVKGQYDFAWLDEHVHGLIACGVKPWMCICYGSRHYGLTAEMGWPVAKITEVPETFAAWTRYVRALVTRYRDVIDEWEVWNEPFGKQADVYSKLVIATADVVHEVQPAAKVYVSAPGAFENYEAILENLKKAGKLECVTAWIYHPYVKNPDANDPWWGFDTVARLQELLKRYNPDYTVIQGEVGCPAQLEYSHALNNHPWSEYSQAKWNLRRMAGEHVRGIPYGVFSMVDFEYKKFMLQSFGLLRMDLAQEVVYRRPTFYACRNMMSFFDSEVAAVGLVDTSSRRTTAAKFRKNGTDVLLVWRSDAIPGDALEFERDDLAVRDVVFKDPVWVELITGKVYALDPASVGNRDDVTFFRGLRLWDSPVMIAERIEVPLRR